jgi:hypothetical protein
MKKTIAILIAVAAFALATPTFAGENSNPCGNHGNHCCTDDGGDSYTSVETECKAFCTSTAEAVASAVSECEANAAASCSQTIGDTVANAVASAVANCASTASNICNVPTCLKWRIRYNKSGQPVARICKLTTEQPLQ